MAQFQFDSTNVPVNGGIPLPIPKGKYQAIMIASEIKPTANGTGAYIESQFKVIDPPHAGHIIYHNFNIRNQSQKAMEIGYGQLSAVCHAVGVLQIQDTTQLHNRPLSITVKIGGGGAKPEGGQYDERNEITNFAVLESAPVNRDQGFRIPAQNTGFTSAPPASSFTPPAATQPWEQNTTQEAPVQQAPAQQMPWQQQPQAQEQAQPSAAMPWMNSNPVPAQQAAPVQQNTAPAPSAGQLPPWMQPQ